MNQNASISGEIDKLDQSLASVARLIKSAELDDSFKGLHAEMNLVCHFDNLILYEFNGNSRPKLLGSNLPRKRLLGQMENFADGLFLLDPFFIESSHNVTGVLRLRDIMPDDFFDSEFYRYHYTHTDVRDEVRFIVPIGHSRVIHVFVEREMNSPIFSDQELGILKAYQPIIDLYVINRMRWLDERTGDKEGQLESLNIAASIKSMGDLTNRECEVIELILRGHATKSVARILDIAVGTVTNHKRNIYAKLDIHSQAQLFELFLKSIASI